MPSTTNRQAESALVALIAEAENLVGAFRQWYDPSAAVGVPAHVTILYPFTSPSKLTPTVIATVGELLSSISSFEVAFTRTARFPDVLYLAPEPDGPFRHLTELLARQFPNTQPYAGEHTDVIPHLTIANVTDAEKLARISAYFERAARGHLPILSTVNEIVLMDNESGRWEIRERFPLAD